jgi:hypothetical protein
VTCTHAGHTITQADIDAGKLTATMIYTATPSAGGTAASTTQLLEVLASDQSQFSVGVAIVSGQLFTKPGEPPAPSTAVCVWQVM